VKRDQSQAVIIITTETKVPDELAGHATVVEWSLPDRSEIAAILDAAINSLPEKDAKGNSLRSLAAPNGTRDAAIDAAIGLTGEEAASCYAKSLVQTKRIDPAVVSNEKRRVIAREKVLEWYEPIPGGLDAVGGLEKLKSWIVARKLAFSPAAKEYGLPSPKGMLAVGVTGCGKSLIAKATATALGVPLLKLDLGALKAKYVGDSEGNIRKAFRVIEAIGRCVVWVDEIEKQMAGSSSGASDGGVSADALGVVLNWMQERTSEAFVIATANDISGLPPELFRKGRFDDIFFVDLPNEVERVAVLKAALKVHKREALELNFEAVADACDGFTGAEIAEIVPAAMYAAFAENVREIDTSDLIAAANDVHKVSDSAGDKIAELRKWATANARSASLKVTEAASYGGGRKLDLDAA
jgi:SpoVK/Ycf46/Vps4 family AAA+-type ATPase